MTSSASGVGDSAPVLIAIALFDGAAPATS